MLLITLKIILHVLKLFLKSLHGHFLYFLKMHIFLGLSLNQFVFNNVDLFGNFIIICFLVNLIDLLFERFIFYNRLLTLKFVFGVERKFFGSQVFRRKSQHEFGVKLLHFVLLIAVLNLFPILNQHDLFIFLFDQMVSHHFSFFCFFAEFLIKFNFFLYEFFLKFFMFIIQFLSFL